jgi:hypothetical protein
VRTRPDYVVVRGEAEAICEVEEFDRDSGWSPGNAGPSGRRSMEGAMYGNPAFAFSMDPRTGEAVDEGGFITTANGKLRNDHPYISAVTVVSQRDRAVDFYDELMAGMDGASADEKWRAGTTPPRIGAKYPRAIASDY